MRFKVYAAALMMAWAGSMVFAQKVTTPEELDKAMRRVGPAMQAANKAIGSSAFAEARKQLGIVKEAIEDSREFWVVHKKDDAIKANKETIAKLDEVDKLLATEPVDPGVAAGALKQAASTCRTCHDTYRARDADNNWVLKPGSVAH